MQANTSAIEQWLASHHIYRCSHKKCMYGASRRIVSPHLEWGPPQHPEQLLLPPAPPSEPGIERVITYEDSMFGDMLSEKKEQRYLRDYRGENEKKRQRVIDWHDENYRTSPAWMKYKQDQAVYAMNSTMREQANLKIHERNERYNEMHRQARIVSLSHLPLSMDFAPYDYPRISEYLHDHASELCHCPFHRSLDEVSSLPAKIGPRRDIVSPLNGWPILRTKGYRNPGVPPYCQSIFEGVRKTHAGWDFESPMNLPVYAIADGRITDISTLNSDGNYGYFIVQEVTLRDVKGNERVFFPFYSHLCTIEVLAGQCVSAGTKIGLTGNTGNAKNMTMVSNGAHLHFGLHRDGIFDHTNQNTLSYGTQGSNRLTGEDNWVDDPKDIFGDPATYYFG